ncbi:NfeD family protein [Marinomonas sp. C2222]|uniref:NfeD family protein n=1 Tax=Marinomonas sargassi TaxID=2984494 RepID=A0ABT2YT29_9GAMM|nr:NfeD family protein [Marinomonas sargassi]MCV2403031.1 NfeD family protein [Marinomonas sargassi]
MDFITNNLAESFLVMGLGLLVIEVAVLGFSTFVLFFVGLAAIASGGLIYFGVIPDDLLSAFLSTGVITVVAATILWKPLKKMQSDVSTVKAQGDLAGHQFILQESVSPTHIVTYQYSGISWKLISTTSIEAGTKVEVIDVQVGEFHIKAVDA